MQSIMAKLKKLIRPKPPRGQRRNKYRPIVEVLEHRCLLAELTWTGAVGTNWFDGGNWTLPGKKAGFVPGSTDDVIIAAGKDGNAATVPATNRAAEAGTVTVNQGGVLRLLNPLLVSQNIQVINDGTIEIVRNGIFEFTTRGGIFNNSVLQLSAGGELKGDVVNNFDLQVEQAGTIRGNVLNNRTVVFSPFGAPPAHLDIQGDYDQNAGASLNVRVANTGIDFLNISGTADLGGSLKIDAGAFNPPLNASYIPLLFGQVANSFTDTQWTIGDKVFFPNYRNQSLLLTRFKLQANANDINPNQGIAFTGTVADFTDPGLATPSPSDFTATINWGDGSAPTSGTITAGSSGAFDVTGTHTYYDPSVFSISVTVEEVGYPPSGVSVNGTATVSGSGGTVNASSFTTLQDAINSAPRFSKVVIGPGTFQQQLTISTDICLEGASQGVTIIQAPSTLTPDAFGKTAIIEINGAHVCIENLTVAGPGPGPFNSLNYGIFVIGDGSLDISNSAVIDIRDDPLSGIQSGAAIRAGSNALAQSAHLFAHQVTISDYQKGAIVVDGNSTALVENNTITGVSSTTLIAQNGIQISRGAVAIVSANTVTGNEYSGTFGGPDPLNDTQSAGILLFEAGAGTVVSGNTVSGNDVGIYNLSNGPTSIDNNTLSGNRYEGLFFDQGQAEASGNSVSGGNIAVAVVSFLGNTADSDATLTGNNITGAGTGILVVNQNLAGGPVANLTASFNRIVGNGVGLNNQSSTLVVAINNWWGSNAGPGGAGSDTVSGLVSFSPWLVLSIEAPSPLITGHSETVIADLLHNSAGQDFTGLAFLLGHVPDGIPLIFGTSLGSIAPMVTSLLDGQAIATLSASAVGNATVTATLDNQTVSTGVSFQTPQQQIEVIIDQVQALVSAGTLKKGLGRSLIHKLRLAREDFNHGRTAAADRDQQAYIAEVLRLERRRVLSLSEADLLLAEATLLL
jgi:parallel beta-helix repeat protein